MLILLLNTESGLEESRSLGEVSLQLLALGLSLLESLGEPLKLLDVGQDSFTVRRFFLLQGPHLVA